MKYIRYLSILFGLLSYFLPMYGYWLFARMYAQAEAFHAAHPDVGMCGMGMFAITIATPAATSIAAFIGSILSFISYRSLNKPRPKKRKVELGLIIFPFLVAAPFFIYMDTLH